MKKSISTCSSTAYLRDSFVRAAWSKKYGKITELKFFIAVRMWYLREHGKPAPSVNFMKGWPHDFSERKTVAHRPISRGPRIKDGYMTIIKQLF